MERPIDEGFWKTGTIIAHLEAKALAVDAPRNGDRCFGRGLERIAKQGEQCQLERALLRPDRHRLALDRHPPSVEALDASAIDGASDHLGHVQGPRRRFTTLGSAQGGNERFEAREFLITDRAIGGVDLCFPEYLA